MVGSRGSRGVHYRGLVLGLAVLLIGVGSSWGQLDPDIYVADWNPECPSLQLDAGDNINANIIVLNNGQLKIDASTGAQPVTVAGVISVGEDGIVEIKGKCFTVGESSYTVTGTYSVSITLDDGSLTGTYENGSDVDLDISCYLGLTVSLVVSGCSTEPPVTAVQIDIKPGSDPNPINPGSNGLVPVAIFGADDFDVATVVVETVALAGREVATRGKAEKLMSRFEDVNDDGITDLLLQVETQSDGELWESGEVKLTGKTLDGKDIEGVDEIVIVPPEEPEE